ncbi:major facilitator superfamily domain-containing protein [Irpex rosettiformis]|uniref:Major facilitator superfamily domain-containing protein n=2 Tax=Irpex rosettiformis TaxID=378272 RepID=A0ACB8TMC6_9APHY|nr:major facilitator superfamily domain-containing protein [Irpex rosettiformis]KAI0083309.1 major facilitator superfamily domain-containing protein [Irpex rosettiformis]
MDFVVLPVVTMIFFLSFLDKGNIGNARIDGLQRDLSMSDYHYSLLLTITFVPYILVELPSNLWLQRIGPDILLPSMTVLWSIATTMQGVVTSYGGLLACRVFLGLFEGGLLPGITLYLAMFYPKDKLQLRISIFFVSTTLAGAFSGLLASAISHMDGVGGRPGWAWIFILEGIFTFLFGVLSFFLLPRTPSHITLLTPAEKAHITNVLSNDVFPSSEHEFHCESRYQSSRSLDEKNAEMHHNINGHRQDNVDRGGVARNRIWRDVWRTMKMPHVWLCVVAGFFNGATLSGLAYFTPSIVASLGYTANKAQLMSVPPFVVAFVVSLVSSYLSDKYASRGLTIIVFAVVGVVGFGMFIGGGSHHPHVRYASLFFIMPSTYGTAPPLAAWVSNNSRFPPFSLSSPTTPSSIISSESSSTSHTPQATSIALLTISTNLGGILATWLLGSWSRAPEWRVAGWVLGGFQVGVGVCAAMGVGVLVWKRGRGWEGYVL